MLGSLDNKLVDQIFVQLLFGAQVAQERLPVVFLIDTSVFFSLPVLIGIRPDAWKAINPLYNCSQQFLSLKIEAKNCSGGSEAQLVGTKRNPVK